MEVLSRSTQDEITQKIEERRLALQKLLEDILGSDDVYYQPPSNVFGGKPQRNGAPVLRMNYPCIRYELDYVDVRYANNNPYTINRRYSITYISREPDDVMVDKMIHLPLCRFDRFYTTSDLNHYVFRLYF